MDYKSLDKEYIAHTYARFDELFVSGTGAKVYNENGKEFIDFTSGIGVNSLGFADSDWADAVANQAHTLQHTSNLYYTKPCIDVAKKLCDNTYAKKVFFANSGAEAIECSIKLARKYSYDKYGENRNKIISLVNSFHGRTMTALSATGQEHYHQFYFPFDSSFIYCPAEDLTAVADAVSQGNVCAIMMELVQGEGGVIKLSETFVRGVAKLCKDNDILLIIDEVQTGIGRTGKLLTSEHYAVTPDITALAKGLGGGLPIGACLMGEKVANTYNFGDHGTTFGGNPVVCAGAKVVLDKLIDNGIISLVADKAEYIKSRLLQCKNVAGIDGLGLMIGISIRKGKAKDVANTCLNNGLAVLTAKDKIRLLPPLAIDMAELKSGMDILIDVIENINE